jgi:hypothetical protein
MENEVVLEGEEPEAVAKNEESWLRGVEACFMRNGGTGRIWLKMDKDLGGDHL